jgi:hypothetical protein
MPSVEAFIIIRIHIFFSLSSELQAVRPKVYKVSNQAISVN